MYNLFINDYKIHLIVNFSHVKGRYLSFKLLQKLQFYIIILYILQNIMLTKFLLLET